MFYGNTLISFYSPRNLLIWFVMAFQAGFLNIAGFYFAGKIVSHVTGFATFFGNNLVEGDNLNAIAMLIIPGFFLLGSMVSGYFVDVRIKLGKNPKYYITFGLMFLLNLIVFVVGVTGGWGKFGQSSIGVEAHVLLIFLCFLCGIQNGTISTVSKSVVRTTHLTGVTTDLGLGIMRMIFYGRIKDKLQNEGQANIMRVGIIFSFVSGSVIGSFLFHSFQYYGFFVPLLISGVLFVTMLYFEAKRT